MNYSALISAIVAVETGGQRNPDMAVGDGNRAIGALQIHKGVIEDVNRFSGTHYTHNQMTNRVAARRVCDLYLQRYAKGSSNEEAARIWNGGPTGPSKTATKRYWMRVSREIKRQQKGGAK